MMNSKSRVWVGVAALAVCFGITACDGSVTAEDGSPRVLPTDEAGFVYRSGDHDFTPEELEPWKRGGSLKEEVVEDIRVHLEEIGQLPDMPEGR